MTEEQDNTRLEEAELGKASGQEAPPQEERVRVLRLLEYVGPRSWIENTFKHNAVKGEYVLAGRADRRLGCLLTGGEPIIIREAILGTFPEVVPPIYPLSLHMRPHQNLKEGS